MQMIKTVDIPTGTVDLQLLKRKQPIHNHYERVKHTHLKQVTLLLTFVSFGLPNIFWIFLEHILNFM